MWGRFALKAPVAELIQHFGLDECVDLTPRYNIPPGTEIAAIRQSPAGQRVLHRLKWGLAPNWAKDPSIGNKLNNAPADGHGRFVGSLDMLGGTGERAATLPAACRE